MSLCSLRDLRNKTSYRLAMIIRGNEITMANRVAKVPRTLVNEALYVPWRRLLSLKKNDRYRVAMRRIAKRFGTDVLLVVPRRIAENKTH